MSTVLPTSNYEIWGDLLIRACDIYSWDKSAKMWKSSDGMWYSLNADDLHSLKGTIINFSKIASLGYDRQWIIAAKALDFIKDILSCPSPHPSHLDITMLTWQLLFDLIYHNTENQSKIWIECNELLLSQLQRNGLSNDTCRLIVYNIYAVGGHCKHEGSQILKMLLNSFFAEKQARPLREQGLTCFLEHFITDDKNITPMYLKLTGIEKIALLHFVSDHLTNASASGSKSFPISSDLLFSISNDFISKTELILHSSIAEETDVQELFALFEAIAHVSAQPIYQMNTFNFALLLNVVRLFSYVRGNDKVAEATFSTTKRNTDRSLRKLILMTISNLVKDNNDHKSMAREAGLIDVLVEFVAKETSGVMYVGMLYALLDMCQTIPLNMESVERIAKRVEFTGRESIENFLYDMTYKGPRKD